jgi:hypothetical protein
MDRSNPKIQAFQEAEDLKWYVRLTSKAFKLDFAPSSETLDAAHSMYAPIRIVPGEGLPTDHPLAAIHQRIAQSEAYTYAKSHQPIIEIGPNAANFMVIGANNNKTHGCTMFSARDQVRHCKAAASRLVRGCRDQAYTKSVLRLANRIPDSKFCVDGWENCNFQANHAIAVHSLYDISLDALAQGMYNHGCHQIQAWMHFPIEALEVDEWTSNTNMYHFKVTSRKEKEIKKESDCALKCRKTLKKRTIHFTFLNDASFGYQHDYDTWMNYLKIGAIDTPYGFAMLIEKQRHNGSQWKICISRTTVGGQFYYRIPTALRHVCKVPDFAKMASNAMCKYQDIEYINVDAEKVKKIYFFIHARTGAGLTLETTKAFSRTLINEVWFDKTIVEHKWNISFNDFSAVCIAVYLMCLLQKKKENKICVLSHEEMAKLDKTEGWFKRFFSDLSEHIDSFFDGIGEKARYDSDGKLLHDCHKKKATALLHGKTKNVMARATLKFYQDIAVEDRVDDYEYTDEYVIEPCEPVAKTQTFEDVIMTNDNDLQLQTRALQDIGNTEGTGKTSVLDWTTQFGMNAVRSRMPTKELEQYDATEQHLNLVHEIEQQLEEIKDDSTKKGLKIVLADALARYKTRTPKKLALDNMAVLKGVPGSGKTYTIVNEYIPKYLTTNPSHKILVIVPINSMVQDYETRIPAAYSCDVRVTTFHKAIFLLRKDGFNADLVIVDEAFLLPIAAINFIAEERKVLLLGDPCQINHVDFGDNWVGCTRLRDIIEHIPFVERKVSRRCPVDVLALPLIKSAYPGISTTSKIQNSIQQMHPGFAHNQARVLAFTNEVADSLVNEGASTVHRVQGKTFPMVILHYTGSPGEKKLLNESPEHLVVALTRHDNTLFVRDVSADKSLVTYMNASFPLTTYCEKANVEIAAMETKKSEEKILDNAYMETTLPLNADREYPVCEADEMMVESILYKIFPVRPMEEYQSTITGQLKPGGDLKGKLRLENIHKDEAYESKKHTVHRFIAGQRVKITRPSDQRMACKTMMERLTKKTKNLGNHDAKKEAKRLFNPMLEMFDFQVTKADRDQCFLEAIEKFQERGHDMSKLIDADGWTDRNIHKVKNHLKAQQKPYTDADPLSKDKAGQGISAWNKSLNFEMTAYTRLLELVLTKKARGKIIIATGRPDEEIMSLIEQKIKPGDRFAENDWTEFDSSQNNVTRQILRQALQNVGCPSDLLKNFMAMLEQRTICDEFLTIGVNDKKDSGAPHTLVDNCLFNMCICHDIIKDYETLWIKGDDSMASGPYVRFDEVTMKEMGKNQGFKLKPKTGDSASFVSFLVNRAGVAYDLPRLTAKITTRNYTDKEDFNNYRDAMGVTLRNIKETAGLNMLNVNALHYRMNQSDMDVLFSFIKRFSTGEIPFSRTVKMESAQRFVENNYALATQSMAGVRQQDSSEHRIGSYFEDAQKKEIKRISKERKIEKQKVYSGNTAFSIMADAVIG